MAKMVGKKLTDMISEAAKTGIAKAKKAVSKENLEKLNYNAGAGVRNMGEKLKKLGKEVGEKTADIKDKAKSAGSWVKKNKGKTALGVGAVGAGIAAMTNDDNKSLKSQLAKIKAKDPSERTASEKRLLRLMED